MWDIVRGQTPLPPDWASVVRPLYKKGDWANLDKWRPIVRAVTEVKVVWNILMHRFSPHLDPTYPPAPHQSIFVQDTVANMDPVDLTITSLDIKGAFLNTPLLLLEAVWKGLGLPFYSLTCKYIRTRKYTVRTRAGLSPCLWPGSRIPQEGAKGPSCTSS